MKNVKNNQSIALAIALLAIVIILLNYNKFTGAASPLTGGMGTYSGTPTINQTPPIINTTTEGTATDSTMSDKKTYTYNVCSKRVIDGKTSGICTKATVTATKQPPDACSPVGSTCTVSGGSSGGRSGGDTKPSKPPEEKPKTHKACIPVSYGSTTYTCGDVSGAGADQCSSPDDCKGKPAENHQVCEYPQGSNIGKCVIILGRGFSSCSSDVSCRPSPGRTSAIGTFFAQLWSSVVAFFSR